MPGARAARLAAGGRHQRGRRVPARVRAADASRGRAGPRPQPALGQEAIDLSSVARILKARAAIAGFDPALISGHSLKRGRLSTDMDRGIHPTQLKQLGRHKNYALLDTYLEI